MKNSIRFSIFAIITAIVLICLNAFIFVDRKLDTPYSAFYAQEENSLDLVSIGNSTVYMGINPCEIWKNDEITSYNITSMPIHLEVILIAIDEIARTQDPQVVYIDINGLTYQDESSQDRFVLEYVNSMPECQAKQNLIQNYSFINFDEKGHELFKNHNDFRNENVWINKQMITKGFNPRYQIQEQKDFILDYTTVKELPTAGKNYLQKLMNKCKQYPEINFVFGKMPRFLNQNNVNETYMLRSAIPTINANGYDYIEWEDYLSDINLDKSCDMYDENHLNAFGAKKFSKYFVNYMKTYYNLQSNNEHSKKTKDSFNESYGQYKKIYENNKKKFNKKNPNID